MENESVEKHRLDTPAFLSAQEVADQIGSSVQHVRQLLAAGTLQGRRAGTRGKWLVPPKEVERFQGPTPEAGAEDAGAQLELHHRQLQGLLKEWLDREREFTPAALVRAITDAYIPPPGLLGLARTVAGKLSQGGPLQEGVPVAQQPLDGWLPGRSLREVLATLPQSRGSAHFGALRQHLSGDVLWQYEELAHGADAQFIHRFWAWGAGLVGLSVVMLTRPSGPLDDEQVMAAMRLIIQQVSHRDSISQALQPLAYALGGELVCMGLQESRLVPGSEVLVSRLRRNTLAMEDQLQRVHLPEPWRVPEDGEVGRVAQQLWDGTLNSWLVEVLGRDSVHAILQSWHRWAQASQVLCAQLETLITLDRLPGSCTACLGMRP